MNPDATAACDAGRSRRTQDLSFDLHRLLGRLTNGASMQSSIAQSKAPQLKDAACGVHI
jgi:hypothetical protein